MLDNFAVLSRYVLKPLLGIPLFLLIDSQYGDLLLKGYGQEVATALVGFTFFYAYRRRTQRVKAVMLLGIFVGLLGEFLFSIVLGMYHYRLENIPLWLAFGHGLIFAVVFVISHKPVVKKHQEPLQLILIAFAVIYSTFWLFWANDWFGFLCTVAFLAILFTAKKSRLFFLIMYALVCYIEIIGTATGSWYWPSTLFGLEHFPSSGNPPTGIAIFYFLFDAAVLWIYLYVLHPKVRSRYQQVLISKKG